MKKEKKKHLLIGIIFLVLINKSYADCDTSLKLCSEALKASENHISAQAELLDNQEKLIQTLAKQRNEAYEALTQDAGRIPWYAWGALGMAAGVILGQTVIFK